MKRGAWKSWPKWKKALWLSWAVPVVLVLTIYEGVCLAIKSVTEDAIELWTTKP